MEIVLAPDSDDNCIGEIAGVYEEGGGGERQPSEAESVRRRGKRWLDIGLHRGDGIVIFTWAGRDDRWRV